MFSLFAHHAEAFFKVEINGRDYPGDGMTEHAIFAAMHQFANGAPPHDDCTLLVIDRTS